MDLPQSYTLDFYLCIGLNGTSGPLLLVFVAVAEKHVINTAFRLKCLKLCPSGPLNANTSHLFSMG